MEDILQLVVVNVSTMEKPFLEEVGAMETVASGINDQCVPSTTAVSCGGHFAIDCSQCPCNGDAWVGQGWCNGDCLQLDR